MNNLIFITCILIISLNSCSSLKKNHTFQDIIAEQTGNKIILKKGKFYLSSTIVLTSGTELIGDNTFLFFDQETINQAVLIKSSKNITIKGIFFNSNELTSNESHEYLKTCNFKHAIKIQDSSKIKIQDCDFINLVGTAIKVLNSSSLVFERCKFENIGLKSFRGVAYSYDGIFLGGNLGVENVTIDSCTFSNIGLSFPPDDRHNDGDGIQILTKGKARNISITNCVFEKCAARGVKIQSGDKITVAKSIFRDNNSAVMIPMLNHVSNVTIASNQIFNNQIAFGTNKAGESADATNLQIIDNEVDFCSHFFRTNGKSNVRNGIIKNNRIQNVAQFVISGRFFDTEITNNKVTSYATEGHNSWNMSILILPESNNVTIEKNVFESNNTRAKPIINRSTKTITLRNNTERIISNN